jgi:hypothetical protein
MPIKMIKNLKITKSFKTSKIIKILFNKYPIKIYKIKTIKIKPLLKEKFLMKAHFP